MVTYSDKDKLHLMTKNTGSEDSYCLEILCCILSLTATCRIKIKESTQDMMILYWAETKHKNNHCSKINHCSALFILVASESQTHSPLHGEMDLFFYSMVGSNFSCGFLLTATMLILPSSDRHMKEE